MIAKIGKGENLMGALLYNQQKVDKEKGEVLLTSKIAESINGLYTVSHINRYFEPYLIANSNTEKLVRHISLNPDPNDKVTDENFRQIAQEYMEKMGYGNQPYIVYKHNDIDRTHIHIVTVCVDLNGNKISDSHDHPKSMAICRDIERKFGLIPTTEKQQDESAQKFRPVSYKDGDIKSQLASVVRYLPRYYKFQNLGTYNALLSLFNITAEKVNGELQGQQKNGLVYFALNEKGEKASNPFKASKFGPNAGLPTLEKHFDLSRDCFKSIELKKSLKHAIEIAMHSTTNELNFKRCLVEQGINAVIRRNESGRIYGITFIDHQSRSVWNASQLSKNISANVFNDLWLVNNEKHTDRIEKSMAIPQKSKKEAPLMNQQLHGIFNFLNGPASFELENAGIFDSFAGIFPDAQGEDYDEIAFENRMKKKRRKGRKRN